MPTQAALLQKASTDITYRHKRGFHPSRTTRATPTAASGCINRQDLLARQIPKGDRWQGVGCGARLTAGLARFVKWELLVEPTWQGTGWWHTGALTPGS